VRKVAAFLKRLGLEVQAVWHSGKVRALQTAEILAPALASAEGLLQRDGLSPTDPVRPVTDELAGMTGDLMVVGHMPFMSRLAALLVSGRDSPEVVAFRQGGVVCLEGDAGQPWRVRWMLVPELLV
jgi:phosphohistidine phosphatase